MDTQQPGPEPTRRTLGAGWQARGPAIVLLIVAAFVVGWLLASDDAPDTAAAPAADGTLAATTSVYGGTEPGASLGAEPGVEDGQGYSPTPVRTVDESGGFRLAALSSNACQAEAPADWAMQANDRSSTVDLFGDGGRLYAGYGIQAVNTDLAGYAGYYEPPLNDPDLYSADPAVVAGAYARIIVAGLGGMSDLVYTDELSGSVGEYRLWSLAGSSHRGVVFFRAAGYPGDGFNYSYVLPMYFAFTTRDAWQTQGLLVARVAASIRCTTQFQPPDEYVMVEAGTGGSDENGDDPGYNPQLGTEYATDSTTGENYLVDPSANWSETGPGGPGYYIAKGGGGYLKLDPGRSD